MADGDLIFLEEQPADGPRHFGLGRSIVWHDPRNRDYPAVGPRALVSVRAGVSSRVWARPIGVFNQDGEPSCVLQGESGLLFTEPFASRISMRDGGGHCRYVQPHERFYAYKRAQKLDPWAGENYQGTSTDAGMKLLRAEGRIDEWRWCFGIDDVLKTLSNYGPVVIAGTWYSGMDKPDAQGLIAHSGSSRGGHLMQVLEVNADKEYVAGPQSWGYGWGLGGFWRMTFDTLDRFLREQGEAATVVIR